MIDGNKLPIMSGYKLKSIIKGDEKVAEISAASIIAKVSRDNFIISLAKKNSGYYWHQNFGYGTKKHLGAIRKLGFSRHHRKSFAPMKK